MALLSKKFKSERYYSFTPKSGKRATTAVRADSTRGAFKTFGYPHGKVKRIQHQELINMI